MTEVIWRPQPGPQTAFFKCGTREIFYGGARGGGKTASLLMHWVRHANRYGKQAVGVLFRRTYPELDEVVRQAEAIYPRLGATWRKADKVWVFPGGGRLYLRYLERDEDASRYQGHQYNWMAFDELTHWPRPEPLDKLRACLRSASGVRCWLLCTGNPGGPGHAWVKARYVSPADPGTLFVGDDGQRRIYIPARLTDNRVLMDNDPEYIDRLKASGPAWLVRAWLDGDWDVTAGSYLEGVWDRRRHVIPARTLPPTWKRWRALDWGYAAPFAVLWFAVDYDGVVHIYRELYGRGQKANEGVRKTPGEVAGMVCKAEAGETSAGITIAPNPADSAIFATQDGQRSIADQFRKAGVTWIAADKSPGSRINGAQVIVQWLRDGKLLVHDCCRHLIECMATIPPDPHNAEDVDTDSEDHLWDSLRYGLMQHVRSHRAPEDRGPKPGTFDWVRAHG